MFLPFLSSIKKTHFLCYVKKLQKSIVTKVPSTFLQLKMLKTGIKVFDVKKKLLLSHKKEPHAHSAMFNKLLKMNLINDFF